MKLHTEKRRRRHTAVPRPEAAKAQQETDFTAEGSPPPGKVGTGQPELPATGPTAPAATGVDGAADGQH